MDLDIATGEIKILKAPKEQQEITVETQKISKSLKFKCYEEEGVLNITTNKKVWNWIYARNHAQDAKINIYIPEGYKQEEVEMNLSAGSIYIEDIHTEDLDIDVDAGEVQVDSFLHMAETYFSTPVLLTHLYFLFAKKFTFGLFFHISYDCSA